MCIRQIAFVFYKVHFYIKQILNMKPLGFNI